MPHHLFQEVCVYDLVMSADYKRQFVGTKIKLRCGEVQSESKMINAAIGRCLK